MRTSITLLALSIAPAIAFSSFGAVATTPTLKAKKDIEHITVIGRKTSQPLELASHIKIINNTDISLSGATNIVDILRGEAGIQVSDFNSGAVFSLRGFGAGQAANNTLILVDGRRLNNIDIAAPSISAIPLNQVERIEILSGSAGVLYGDQAVGGVINIVTRSPENTGGSVTLSAGNLDTIEGRADVASAINNDWSYYLTGHHQQSDNYRHHNANETGSLLGRLQYQSDESTFFVESSYYDNNRELANALNIDQLNDNPRQFVTFSFDGKPTDYFHDITKVARSGYGKAINKTWRFDANIDYTNSEINGISYGGATKNQRSLLNISPKFIGNYSTNRGSLNLIIGADVSRGESEFLFGRSNTQKLGSLYTQASVPLSNKLNYVVGGRYSKVKDDLIDATKYPNGINLDESAHALELGLNYRPSIHQRFYLRAEDNFRFAKVDEQAFTSPNVFGLKPQTGRSYEAGWDYNTQKQNLKISLYHLELEDEIVFDPSATPPTPTSFSGANINADASRRIGTNFDWNIQANSILNIGVQYNYINAEFTEGSNKGKALSWVAEHTAKISASADITKDWQIYAEANYIGSRFIEGDNSNSDPKLSSYTLANLAINYTFNDWQASLRADNVLNKEYVSAGYYSSFSSGYYPGEGRRWRFSLRYQF
ncbi:TonB-dependent receptor [Parashewanella spongiae]|uniref:TonB-dependent receptor n=1 Tax=Parashewanella spongiae TaxID=342950 RepID=A0A3A6TI87_9GAMM|nr:TonB-dependent receptor [Parashewanella spongiae]MCL1079230.1 TonB-dependent receptor [Parashewanella spongiae]RJY07887.1 TonB-dependent receptor [Parashewanella spongiae]